MNTKNLLWSTYGKEWGFRRLLEPHLECESWLSIYDQVFDRDSTEKEQFKSGKVTLVNSQIDYISVIFPDPELRKDQATRIILHKIAIFGEDSKQYSDVDSVRKKVWPLLSSVYDELYEYSIDKISKIELKSDNSSLIIQEKIKAVEGNTEEKKTSYWTLTLLNSLALITIVIIILLSIYLYHTNREEELKNQKNKNSHSINLQMEIQSRENTVKSETLPEIGTKEENIIQKEIN